MDEWSDAKAARGIMVVVALLAVSLVLIGASIFVYSTAWGYQFFL
jgi:hypothetical protein